MNMYFIVHGYKIIFTASQAMKYEMLFSDLFRI